MRKRLNPKALDSNQKLISGYFSPTSSPLRASQDPSSATNSPAASSTTTTPVKQTRPRAGLPSPRKRLRYTEDGATSAASSVSDDTSSTTSTSRDNAEDSIQPTAIYKLIFERLYKKLQAQSGTNENVLSPEEQVIETIIRKFNEDHQRRRPEEDEEEDPSSFRLIDSNPIILPENLKRLLRRDHFQTRLYVKETYSQNYILKFNDSTLQNTNIHIIWFFYRHMEIFALTTNQGWHVVQNYSDFHFPIKVAARLCSEEGATKTSGRVLIGEVTKQAKTTQIGKGSSIHDNPVLCNSFTAELRKDASILKFPCFESDRIKTTGRTTIEFGLAFVRFNRRFKVEDIPLVLDHLSAISRGESTFKFSIPLHQSETSEDVDMNDAQTQDSPQPSTSRNDNVQTQLCTRPQFVTDEEVSFREDHFSDLYQFSQEISSQEDDLSMTMTIPGEETDAAIYRRNLARVPPDLSKELDQALVDVIFEAIMKSKITIGCYAFCYKNNPQNYGSLLEIFKRKSLGTLPVHPTLKDIFEKIRPEMDMNNAKDELRKRFQIRPQRSDQKKNNWFDFIEAELFHKDRIFWRVDKTWCTIHPGYIFSSHVWFKEFLKTNLVTDENEKHLDIPWRNPSGPRRLSVESMTNLKKPYIEQYKGREGFYLPPEPKQFLFDLLYIDTSSKPNTQIYIYFISSDFNSQTAEASLRIFRCMEEISLTQKNEPSGYFYELYKHSFQNNFTQNCFKKLLAKSIFLYALAHVPDQLTGFGTRRESDSENLTSWMKRSLLKERETPAAITKAAIQKLLKDPECPLSKADILNILELNTFAEDHGGDRDIYTRMAAFMEQRLVLKGYVTKSAPTLKFLYSNVHNFSLGLKNGGNSEQGVEYENKVFAVMSHFQPQYASLKATIELRNVATTHFLKTRFKIYEIQGE